jgi:hypothetical protein
VTVLADVPAIASAPGVACPKAAVSGGGLMYDASDRSYRQARLIKKGEHRLSPEHEAIVHWVSNTWQVRCLDFAFSKKEMGGGYREQMVYLAVETLADCERLEKAGADTAIAQCFTEHFRKRPSRAQDPTKNEFFLPTPDGTFPKVLVDFCSLEKIEAAQANRKIASDVKEIAKNHADRIQSISTNNGCDHTVWLATEQDVKDAHASGFAQQIRDEVLAALKQHDEFGYFGPHSISVSFDSTQALDSNYDGEIWKYYR